MTQTPLFRTAALEANRVKWLGEIVLVRPMSFSVLAGIAACISLVVFVFVLAGSYAKRTSISGQLASDVGILKVFAIQPGVVVEKMVKEGQPVATGDRLFMISSERQSGENGGVHEAISRQVALRQQSLRDELRRTQQIQLEQEEILREKISALRAEQANVMHQLTGQRQRVELSRVAAERFTRLLTDRYISTEMAQQKEADFIDRRNRLQALERDEINVGRELQTHQKELSSLPLHHRNQLAQIERTLNSATQELAESEGRRRTAIIATGSGIATAVTAEPGQAVDNSRPLVTIIPHAALLEAHLYAPSNAIGFIRVGDHVSLRYQAYPYQKFGHAQGTVATITRAAVPASEITAVSSTTAPIYRITVRLPKQIITVYGKPAQLKPGMLVDADILQERRKIYEWVLEPLFTLTGKLN